MSEVFPIVYLARHGETAWTISGQHTGLTDLPLTERGERNASRLQERLRGLTFAKVLTSPLQRARRTCELSGFGTVAEVDRDLVEWNYGDYEGRTTAEIRATRPTHRIEPARNRTGLVAEKRDLVSVRRPRRISFCRRIRCELPGLGLTDDSDPDVPVGPDVTRRGIRDHGAVGRERAFLRPAL